MSQSIDRALNSKVKDLFGTFAVPGMVGMLIVSLYNFIDSIFVGQFIGPEAVAAVSISYPVVIINQAISVLVGSGSMALLSRTIGAKDETTSKKIFGTLVLSIATLSFVFSLIIFFFSREVMLFLGAKENVFILGNEYLKILAMGLVFGSVGPGVNMLLRGEGKMKEAMSIMAIGTVLNIILDPLLIYYFNLGVTGAAAATVISQFIIFLLSTSYIITLKSVVPVSLKHFRLYAELFPQIIPIGIGPMIMLFMVVVQQTFLFRILSDLGGIDQLAIMGASYRVYYFAFVPLWGISQGLLPLIGINYGAKKFKRIWAIFNSFTLKATAISSIIWLALMLFGNTVLSWFITDEALVTTGASLFKILNCAIFAAGFLNTPIVMFQATGKAKQPLMILVGRQIVFFLPLLFILPHFFGLMGVWLSIPISDFLIALVALALVIYEKNKMLKSAISPQKLQPVRIIKQVNDDQIAFSHKKGRATDRSTIHGKQKRQGIQTEATKAEHERIIVTLTNDSYQSIRNNGFTPSKAVEMLGISQAQVSALMNCNPVSISIDSLIRLFKILGQEIEVTVTMKPDYQQSEEKQQKRISPVKLQPA